MSSSAGSRRRFGTNALVLGVVLVAVAALLPTDGAFRAIALVVCAWGVGLAVAGLFLLVGHNPLRKSHDDPADRA